MRPDCRKRVGNILGRPMMAEEERAIDRRMRRAVKQLKRTEPGWKDMTKMQRLDKAAALAGDSFETELAEFRMEAPPKAAPLPQDVRQAEADRQKRMEDLGFTIQAVRGVRFVRRQGNPEDGELTGGRWFTDRPDTANTYSGKPGGDMATASMKVRIRLRNPLVVDAQGKRFDQIPRASLPEAVQKEAIRGKMLSTDDIADAARIAEGNYDGVIFKNLKDDLTSNAITTKPATVYAVFDRKNIRSEFAQFDPEFSEMPGLLFQSAAPDTSTPEGRAEWVQNYTTSEVIPGEAVSSRMYGFKLKPGVTPVMLIAPDITGGAAAIEWTFAERVEADPNAPSQDVFNNTGDENLTAQDILALAGRLRAILEADIETFGRDAYVFTPWTDAHRKVYRRGLRNIPDYEVLETEDDIYLVHKDADIAGDRSVIPSGRPQPDTSPEPGVMGETSPEERSQAFSERLRNLPDEQAAGGRRGAVGSLFQRGDPKGWGETTPPPDLPPMRLNLAYTRDAYGDDAVKRLPAPIRERAASGSSVDSMMDVVRAVKKTLKRKPPKTLTKWINAKRRGYGKSTVSSPTAKGINGIKGAAEELRTMGLEKLINEKSGTDLDYVREAAIEDGFLPEGATVNDLLAAMDAESRGEPTYSRFDEAEVLDLQAAEAWEKMFDDAGINVFEDSDRELRKKLSGFVSSQNDDAVTPDQAAEKFGFGSGEELLNALANIGNRERHIAKQVRREMQQEFGDPFNDGALTEKARVLAESEMRARAGEIELEALARAVGEVAASRMAKDMARDTLQHLTVKELSQWRRYLQAERREMQNAMDAVKRGDTVQAFIHKRRQMVNMHLAREGEKLFEQIEKQRKDLQKYETSKNRRDRIAGDYLEKIDDLLAHFELRVSKQGPKEQRRRMSAALWVKQMIEEGREAEIPAEANLLAELADTKVWRDLTSEQVEYLVATIQNLAHLGRLKNRLISDREQRKFAAVRSELVERLRAAPSSRNRSKAFTPTRAQNAMSWLRELDAKLTKLEDQFAMMDGQENGPLFNFFAQPFNEQDVAKLVEIKKLTRALTAAYNRMPGRMQRTLQKRVATPELALPNDTPMTLFDAIIIGLNFGNQGNRDALVAGYGWELNAIESMLDRVLPTEAWDFIEDVWSIVNSYRDAAFALHKDITGVEPKAVDPIKFKLSSGREIAGGYYPLKYDGDQARADSVIVRKMSEKEMLNELGMSFTKPMTKTGHLISRIGSGGKPVKISIDVLHEHLENVVHDIFFRRAVIDAHKMIKDPEFTQAYIDAAGKDQYDRLMPWLTDIATNNKAKLTGAFNKNMKAVRSNISLWLMGYKFGTAVQQLTGFMEALPEIGPRYMIQGMAKAYASGPRSFWENWNFIRERSEYLSTRVTFGKDRDIRAITTSVGNRTPYRALKENGFIFLSLMDAGIGTAVWRGAFDRAMDGHTNGINARDEEAAIAYADQVVRRALTSGETHQLPEIMRGSELDKFVTSIYSYGSKQYNRTRHKTYQVRYGQIGWPEYIASMFVMHAMVPIVAAILAGRFWPWPDDDEDPEDVASAAATEVYMNAVGMIPVFRDLASAFLKPQYGYQMSPVQSGVEKIIGASRRAAEGESFTSEYAARELLDAFSVAFGLPGQQLWITGDYVWDVMEGEEDPMEDPVDAAREALLRNER